MVEVKSLARALDVLRAVADSDTPLSATMVADQLGRDRIQIARTLHSLESAELLERDTDRRYTPSPRVFGVVAGIAAARLRTFGTEALCQTVEATGESAFIAEVRGDSSVAILERLVSGVSWVGRSFPLYCDDAGQALLWDCTRDEIELIFRGTDFVSYSPTTPTSVDDFYQRLVRARGVGYSLVDGESQPGVYAIAAPVRDFTGTVRCALHIQGPTSMLAARGNELGPTITVLADRLSERLGWRSTVST
ncbi:MULTISPECIES: IclR family transcriptional regulator [unclassified Mycolicibacterium]|uniref:IclR family transcriptional regulator n=1 Tax=unclassified Mycolicibacterium TaxID=2636767 RepID=UPI001308468A|nr:MULTISPECIES: IclR family transcriptional regulator [unclassified Mycolicibacterium]MUL81636.1 IclR family transcriptional regulator [Mycolicibacterium sp. CBMA 329]MUL87402.1 IclR family transcriptional regulator [Mycolicibacterium sp. CBMA 331]MUL99732.1 IclR family transcriptional regulator [Mycolicibacterium sp. CBMA 334]MUM25358.1 IclR family transcriptional regulator [Mycolicibacterium sp. CBMA 295]MUM37699.1 IclR family transcriptional regulator [Mycolicibacterium sp. CBMA 247]